MADENESDWTEGAWEPADMDVSPFGRIELMEIAVACGEHTRLVDPDDEEPGNPAGVLDLGVKVMLDMGGHIHIPEQPCIPVRAPFIFDLDTLTTMIDSLQTVKGQLLELMAERGES